ncbi:hypothetical protein PAHAL_6G185600 [Panicum hallii]|uniref:Uncharacterized protein n=1 Tax=Panicum hallii TaxID=206008 RepID=A0A2T8IGR9_9POAL|nr:hypothetical protein PAHAL_6G185600 [Panicum hallii]
MLCSSKQFQTHSYASDFVWKNLQPDIQQHHCMSSQRSSPRPLFQLSMMTSSPNTAMCSHLPYH